MQLYFMKASYTNNIYKKSEFFLAGDYKLDVNKMIDINFRPDEGLTQFITKNVELPDETDLRDHTHVIVPSHDKVYKLVATDYLNHEQYQVTLEEDAFLSKYLTLETTDIFRTRSNDPDDFRGLNDVSDQTIKETVTTKVISPTHKTGKWALLFMQLGDNSAARYGLKFQNGSYLERFEPFTNMAAIVAKYPEVTTEQPELYDYYQKIVFNIDDLTIYQCVYAQVSGIGGLYWSEYNETTLGAVGTTDFYFKLSDSKFAQLINADIKNIVIALPFETTITGDGSKRILSFNNFVGPITTGALIDIKIVNDLIMPINSITYTGVATDEIDKVISGPFLAWDFIDTYEDDTTSTANSDWQLMTMFHFEYDIELDPSYISGTINPLSAEPFYKYDLYVFGKKYQIPYYLTDDVHLLIALNSGVINYIVYYNDRRNILAAGSFTHSARYQIDQLDAFYNQNPTYKEQFYTKMATDATKTMIGGAIGGSVVPGIGTIAGAAGGLVAAGVDAGISQLNLHYQEKGLRLKPDQIFGEISELSLQMINVFGVYWVKRESENRDQMQREYELRGFPTTKYDSISDMDFTTTTLWGSAKIVYGELKEVVRNEYTTAFINEKLKQGVVIIQ